LILATPIRGCLKDPGEPANPDYWRARHRAADEQSDVASADSSPGRSSPMLGRHR